MNDAREDFIRQTRKDLQKLAQRMEGSSESQVYKAIQAQRVHRWIPIWLRPILFPLSIGMLFLTQIFVIVWLIQHTDLPLPWDVEDPAWMYWHLLMAGQTLLTGGLYYWGERHYGKLPGIPRGSLYSLLVTAVLLPGLILALVVVSLVYARFQIRRGQSGVWLRSLGGWNRRMVAIGAAELIVLWLVLMAQSADAISAGATKPEAGVNLLVSLFGGLVTSDWFPLLITALGVLGLLQALTASILIVCDVAVEEEAADVTPLLATMAPLVVLSPVGLMMLITYSHASYVHELWLAILKLLGGVWAFLAILGMLYVAKRWVTVYQSVVVMLVGYLLMLPFFVDHVQHLPAEPTSAVSPERFPPNARRDQPSPRKSPRAIDILRDQ